MYDIQGLCNAIGDGNYMEKMERWEKYRQGKKQVSFAVNEALYEDFKAQLEKDNLTIKEVLETAIYQYLNGIMVINKD